MAELTKEWLKQTIAEYEANRDELPFGLDTNSAIELQAFKLALASLEAEPVAWEVTFTQIDREYNTFTGMYPDKAEVERWVRLHKACNFRADITPLYTAQPVPVTPDGWISCSERMPDNNHDVLFFDVWGYIRIGWFSADDRSWFTSDDGCCMEVTHWMHLPEPPQEVNRG
ncbi:DUF551 domain-containing protein [Escherichia coli]|uniref:DUF551 domain-containing protein n=1 Tax=Escherichia coli TaxID=562 RepID=UPI00102046D1|nr:DUF551 domain-containing protein [Escherichia coli]ELI5541351.1 DUF551 domain-containing protein [Escherichia coli]